MNESTADTSMQDGLVFEARLPLQWWSIDGLPDEQTLASHDEANEIFLKTLSALDERTDNTEEGRAQHADFARLDLKINILMELVGQLVASQLDLPTPRTVKLGAHTLQWRLDEVLAQGSLWRLDLYLKPSLPRPLVLFGNIRQEAQEACVLTYQGMGPAVRDAIERLIFRHHRRLVALRRADH